MSNASVTYLIEACDPHTHLFDVTLTIAEPAATQRVSLPVWIPGSYLVREFSKNLQHLTAQQGRSKVAAKQLDKCTWQIECKPGKPLVLRYQIYAHDNSVRTAWLDAERGFFNGTSVCLKVEGHAASTHVLEVLEPAKTGGWSVATGLKAEKISKQGYGTYSAASYDELVDCPVELGKFWSGTFMARGVPHRFVVAGALPGFENSRTR